MQFDRAGRVPVDVDSTCAVIGAYTFCISIGYFVSVTYSGNINFVALENGACVGLTSGFKS
jgi:hypothetical protein